MALLSDAPRTASVESASDETQLLEISAPVLADLSLRYPQVAQALKKFCRQRMLVNVMGTSMFFRPFDKKDRKAVIERFRAREVKKGDVIIRENERSDGLYVLLSGEVEVKKGTRVLATLKEGDLFGEMSLIKNTPATATVSATRRTSLMRLPREDFEDIMGRHPQLLAMICDLMENRRRQTEALLASDPGVSDDDLMLV
jgi:CRP-like cAMP-binding protein